MAWSQRPLVRYGAAVVSIVTAILLRWALSPFLGVNAPFFTFFLAVVFAAWYGGMGPALLALALGAAAAAYLFLPPYSSFWIEDEASRLALSLYLVAGTVTALFSELQRRAQRRAEAKTREAAAQREWFRVTLASIGDAVIATDGRGHVLYMNAVASVLTGWSPREAEGRPLEEVFRIVDEATRRPAENPVGRVLKENAVVGLANHTVLIARDGTERPIDDSGAPIRDEKGRILGVVLVFRDVTERRRVDAERREGEARKSAMLATALDAIITIDHEGRIIDFNPAAERIFGYRRDAVLGQLLAERIIPPAFRESHQRGLTRFLTTGESSVLGRRVEMPARRADGTEFPAELALNAIRTGRDPEFTAYIRDITQRRQAEQTNRFLALAGDALVSSLDFHATLAEVTDLAVPGFADWGVVRLLHDDGRLRLLSAAHADPTKRDLVRELFDRYPPDPDAPFGPDHVVRTGRPDFYPEITETSVDRTARDEEHGRLLKTLGFRSYLCVPMSARGRTLGAMTFVMSTSGRRFGPADLATAEELARRVALAIDNARLYREAQENQARLRFLAEASTALGSSLDYQATLATVARLAVPHVADWCVVDMAEPNGTLRPLVVAHADPAKERIGIELARRDPARPDEPYGPRHVFRTGQPEVVSDITPEMLASSARDAEHLEMIRALGLTSYVCVPLEARGRVLGTITFVAAESGRRFGPPELALAQDLARRAAQAVDNARLYHEAREAARRSEETLALLDTLMKTAPVGLAFVDRDLRYIRINDSLAAIDGLRPEDALGKTMWEVVPDLAPKIEPLYRGVLDTGEPIVGLEVIGQTRAAPGEERHWLVDYFPVRTADGSTFGIGAVVSDITAQKRAEQELRQAKEAAESASHAKDQFLAVLSHELRTPLTPVLVGVSALLEDPDTPQSIVPTLEITRRNIDLEARLIDDLLDVTRISQSKLRLNRRVVDAHGLILQAVEICRDEIATAGLRLELNLLASQHHIEADAARVQQIVWNLIKNAVKFTPTCGLLTIHSANERPIDGDAHERLVIEVTDTGIGIEPGVLPKIFNAFEQGDALVTRQFGGLGLGLAISRSLADAHGGRLIALSEGPGRGSTFRLELPSVAAPPLDLPATPPPDEADEPARPLRILLVEDSADTLRVMSRLLRARGHHVVTAARASEGFEATLTESFDLLISDIGLPDGSGLDLMRKAQALGVPAGIALSGFGMETDLRKSEEAGFSAHLIKPVDFATLEAAIRRVASEANLAWDAQG